MFSAKSSFEFGQSPRVPSEPPPAYRPTTSMAPVFVTEMTTRTEVVTRTTTETTTHLFSMPHWRKRTGSQPSPHRGPSVDVKPSTTSPSRPLLVDKALPPTPPEDECLGLRSLSNEIHTPPSPLLLPAQRFSRDRCISGSGQSASLLAQAALGLGLPHASSSALQHREGNSVKFGSLPTPPSSSSTSLTEPSSQIRRVKSSQRIEGETTTLADPLTHRRRRGFSFGTTTFLGIGGSAEAKTKAKEPEPHSITTPTTSPPKSLSRKSSFWKRRSTSSKEALAPAPPSDGQLLPLPSLPPVHHISPFGVEFPSSSLHNSNFFTPRPPSHGDNITQPPSCSTSTDASPRPSLTLASAHQASLELPPVPSTRSRAQNNSPLLRRLSLAVFSSPEPPPVPPVIRPSTSSHFFNQPSSSVPKKSDNIIPKPLVDDESPEIYLERLKSEVSKSEVAGILASSSDPFYARALQAYFEQFQFSSLPLDVALRKSLMEVGLPRETQQIDRVMEAFASQYCLCNPKLFTSNDHPYILAFSLIMLHTYALTPSNKRKMTKADYIKNTKLPGIPTEVLDCFFDNIVFAPFIFIEDPVDFNGQPGLSPEVARSPTSALPTTPSSATPFKIGNRVDPYYMITNNLLDPLRVHVPAFIPLENPFSYEGTAGPWDESDVHRAFINANVIEVDIPNFPRSPTMFSMAGSPNIASLPLHDTSHFVQQSWTLKITKIGLLNRKDDFMEGGKKAINRKWRSWSVILTGSQLLFCRDPTWASTLLPRVGDSIATGTVNFRPDELFSLKDALAVYDRSYTKYLHTFRFVLPDGRHLLLQAGDDNEMNQWISRINYASTFKTAGIRMRPSALSSEDVHLTGVAAATSHLHDIQTRSTAPRPLSWGSNAHKELRDMLSGQPPQRPQLQRRVTMSGRTGLYDNESVISPEVDGAEQFKATFDQVKADLAANCLTPDEEGDYFVEQTPAESPPSSPRSIDSNASNSRLPSRSQIILTKIRELDTRLVALQTQLDSDERLARNIAILTPFRKTTRSRLLAGIQSMARTVLQVRLEMEKVKCHRDVLRGDLASEGKVWSQSKRVALKAAKDTLLTRRPKTAPLRPSAVQVTSPILSPSLSAASTPMSTIKFTGAIPGSSSTTHRLTDSDELTRHLLRSPTEISAWSRASRATTMSTTGSFYSAQENPSLVEWPASPIEPRESPKISPSGLPKFEHDLNSSVSSIFIHPSMHEEDTSLTSPLSLDSSRLMSFSLPAGSSSSVQDSSADESNPDEEEQAEEWNRTRAAKRVSLIQVPVGIVNAKRLIGVGVPIVDDE